MDPNRQSSALRPLRCLPLLALILAAGVGIFTAPSTLAEAGDAVELIRTAREAIDEGEYRRAIVALQNLQQTTIPSKDSLYCEAWSQVLLGQARDFRGNRQGAVRCFARALSMPNVEWRLMENEPPRMPPDCTHYLARRGNIEAYGSGEDEYFPELEELGSRNPVGFFVKGFTIRDTLSGEYELGVTLACGRDATCTLWIQAVRKVGERFEEEIRTEKMEPGKLTYFGFPAKSPGGDEAEVLRVTLSGPPPEAKPGSELRYIFWIGTLTPILPEKEE